jgi:uncharacterized protein (TIGR00297 family)
MYQYLLPVIAGVIAYLIKSLDEKGAIIGTTFGILMVSGSFGGFALLLIFFILGDLATKYKYSFKKKLGVAGMTSIRKSSNVVANGIVPVIFSLVGYPAGVIGSISTAMADTLSSEIGTASGKKPRLITNFKLVKIGAHGGVTGIGTLTGILGTLLIGSVAYVTGMFSLQTCILTAVVGGVVGFIFDSYLGATLQKKGLINNSHVNLIATAVGGLIAIPLALL